MTLNIAFVVDTQCVELKVTPTQSCSQAVPVIINLSEDLIDIPALNALTVRLCCVLCAIKSEIWPPGG